MWVIGVFLGYEFFEDGVCFDCRGFLAFSRGSGIL